MLSQRLIFSWQAVVFLCVASLSRVWSVQSSWTHWGGNVQNWRFSDHSCVDTGRLAGLSSTRPLWSLTTSGTVAATPAVCGNHVFYVDWGSRIVKLTLDGRKVWEVNAKDMIPNERSVGVRTTPAFSEGCRVLYVATQWSQGSYMLAINSATGKLQYPAVKLDVITPSARATSSPTYYKGAVYLGISSSQENAETCCTFRGSLVKVDGATGRVLWRAYSVPPGYSGGSLWGSSPAIDAARNQVCVGTANLYSIPASVLQCLRSARDGSPQQLACVPGDVHVDAIVCFNLVTGKPNWSYKAHGLDVWGNIKSDAPDIRTMFAGSSYVAALDYGFGQAPIIINNTIIATSKGARTVALNAATGRLLWSIPRLEENGYSMFGSCTNGRLFCSGMFWYQNKNGVVTCMDVRTGRRVWSWRNTLGGVYGPLTCTQNQVFAPLMDPQGSLMVLDINSGRELGRFATGATLFCGPAIVNGTMYMGTGYGSNGGDNKIKAVMAVRLPLTRAGCR